MINVLHIDNFHSNPLENLIEIAAKSGPEVNNSVYFPFFKF